MVLLQINEVEDHPRLDVDGERTKALVASLVDVTGSREPESWFLCGGWRWQYTR
jgi:hypothetical protein